MSTRTWIVSVLLLVATHDLVAGRRLLQTSAPQPPSALAPDSCKGPNACNPFSGPLGPGGSCTPGQSYCTCTGFYGLHNIITSDPTTNNPMPACRFSLKLDSRYTASQLHLRATTGKVATFFFDTVGPDGSSMCTTDLADSLPISKFTLTQMDEASEACQLPLTHPGAIERVEPAALVTSELVTADTVLPNQAVCTRWNHWVYQFAVPAVGCYDMSVLLGEGSTMKFVLHARKEGLPPVPVTQAPQPGPMPVQG